MTVQALEASRGHSSGIRGDTETGSNLGPAYLMQGLFDDCQKDDDGDGDIYFLSTYYVLDSVLHTWRI